MSNYCHEDIICPDCKEHTTRHDPCCAGVDSCDCLECKGCGELFEDLPEHRHCEECADAARADIGQQDACEAAWRAR